MKFRTLTGKSRPLALLAAFCMASATALAQSPPPAAEPDDAEEEATPVTPPAEQKEDLLKDVDIDKLDWSQLNVDASMLNMPSAKSRSPAKSAASDDAKWSSDAKGNGASSVSVKQQVSPFWDARIGADMTVVNPARARPAATCCGRKFRPTGHRKIPPAAPGARYQPPALARSGTRPRSRPASTPAPSRVSSAPASANRCR